MTNANQKLRIKMSPLGSSFLVNEDHHLEAQHDWLQGTFLQGGDKGIVISRNKDVPSYTTSFVEAFPPESSGGGFYRGEGSSIAEAETAAWNKWQKSQACEKHEWEARGYTNGGGFCKHCKCFGSEAFTAEQLGQFCMTCNVATFWGQVRDSEGKYQWYCEDHIAAPRTLRRTQLDNNQKADKLDEEEKSELSLLKFFMGIDGDCEEDINDD